MTIPTVKRKQYTRKDLLVLQRLRCEDQHPIPAELRAPYQGYRAGAKLKARGQRYKPCIPSFLMGNVNSLSNKCDELEAL